MAATLEHAAIRSLPPAELPAYFTSTILDQGWKPVWDSLICWIEAGLVPSNIVHVFLCQCRNPAAVVAAMRQQTSKLGRRIAFTHFGRWSRRDDKFLQAWNAIGGADGLMLLMASFSVIEVEQLCRALHLNCKDNGAQSIRRQHVTELYNALSGHDGDSSRNPDQRPLINLYNILIPSCTSDVVLRTLTSNRLPKRSIVKAHLPAFQQACWNAIFATPAPGDPISMWRYVLDIDSDFAFKVFEKLVQSPDHVKHNADSLVSNLVLPLANRLTRRRDKLDVHVRLYNLFSKCLEIEPNIAVKNKLELTTALVRAWRRPQENHPLERHLQTLFSLSVTVWSLPLPFIQGLLDQVPPPSRFGLLKLFLKYRPDTNLDLDSSVQAPGSQKVPDELYWPDELFHNLPSRTAWQFYEKVRDGGVFGWPIKHGYLYNKPTDPSSENLQADMDYFSTRLASKAASHGAKPESGQWLDKAVRVITTRKNKAAIARESGDREKWALSAIKLSSATGVIETYGSALQWARRFVKDPMVGHKLLTFDLEVADLLSAVPDYTQWTIEREARVNSEVLHANSIVMHVLETAAMLSREPGYEQSQMHSALGLPSRVVAARLKRVNVLVARKLVTDEWARQHVWAPTTSLVLNVERFLMDDSHKALDYNYIAGPLQANFSELEDGQSRHVCWFLDELAKERDQLWREYRARQKPATVTLPAGWPRGLAVDHLFHFDLDGPGARLSEMPYLLSRLRAAVFVNGEAVLKPCPEDEESQDAIGDFVDSYHYALNKLVNLSDPSQRLSLIAEAWTHATTVLTGNRMSPVEATRFWKNTFQAANILAEDLPIPMYSEQFIVRLPSATDGSFPVEWNPQPTIAPVRTFPSTCLDCMLQTIDDSSLPGPRLTRRAGQGTLRRYIGHGGIRKKAMKREFQLRQSVTISVPSIWNTYEYLAALPLADRDALAVAAISLIDARCGADSSPFLRPYPSADTPRKPAVYLDEEFLEEQNKLLSESRDQLNRVLNTISRLSVAIPNDLLVRLARSLLKRMKKEEKEGNKDSDVQAATLAIIKRLNSGDCPASSLEFVRHVVLERQEDSSWHRHLLDRSLLKALPAEDAKTFIQELATAIEEKLQDQRRVAQERKAMTAEGGKTEKAEMSSTPIIKISTVKMIAQILRWANFIDRVSAFKILASLLDNSTHPDVVICIVESLLQQRIESNDADVRKAVVDIIAEKIVPLAGSLDERSPMDEEAWRRAEAGETSLPEFYSASQGELPPLMKLLSDALEHPATGEKSPERQDWMERVIIPVVRLSTKNHMRWTRLFLRRNDFCLSTLDILPSVPADLDMLFGPFANQTEYMPADTMSTVARLVAVVGVPPAALKQVFKKIRQDKDLARSDAGKRFLSIWSGEGRDFYVSASDRGVEILTSFMKDYDFIDPPDGAAGMTLAKLQKFVIGLSEELIRRGDLEKLSRVQSNLYNRSLYCSVDRFRAEQAKWDRNIRPVLEAILAAIKSIHAGKESLHELNGIACTASSLPAELPDTLWYRHQFIIHTHERHAADAVSPEEITACADAILSELDAIIDRCEQHDDKTDGAFKELCDIPENLYKGKHLLLLALKLGELEISPAVETSHRAERTLFHTRQNMRVSMVAYLLKKIVERQLGYLESEHDMVQLDSTPQEERDNLAAQTFAMLDSWRTSGIKYVAKQADVVLAAAVSSNKKGSLLLLSWLTERLEEKGQELEQQNKRLKESREAEMDSEFGSTEDWTSRMKELGIQ